MLQTLLKKNVYLLVIAIWCLFPNTVLGKVNYAESISESSWNLISARRRISIDQKGRLYYLDSNGRRVYLKQPDRHHHRRMRHQHHHHRHRHRILIDKKGLRYYLDENDRRVYF